MARQTKKPKKRGRALTAARHGFRALMLARRMRAALWRRRRRDQPESAGPSRRVMVLSVLGALALAAGLYLLRDRIPGPWRKAAAPDYGGPPPSTPTPPAATPAEATPAEAEPSPPASEGRTSDAAVQADPPPGA